MPHLAMHFNVAYFFAGRLAIMALLAVLPALVHSQPVPVEPEIEAQAALEIIGGGLAFIENQGSWDDEARPVARLSGLDRQKQEGRWETLGTGDAVGVNGVVYALAHSGTALYVGGNFTEAGGKPAFHVARWDGQRWHSLGEGLNGIIRALAVMGSDVYAGGYFSEAGGQPASNVARWDGEEWHAIGTGVNHVVYALTAVGGEILAGGRFSEAGGIPARGIARWDGDQWHPLHDTNGLGLEHSHFGPIVTAINAWGDDLFIGGFFTRAGDEEARYLARWDGTRWHSMNVELLTDAQGSPILQLVNDRTHLYIGGFFFGIHGVRSNALLRWDGEEWHQFSVRASTVRALVSQGGEIFVGAGEENNVPARWTGDQWQPLGPGWEDDGYTEALAIGPGGELFAGGYFTTADGRTINNVARWVPATQITDIDE